MTWESVAGIVPLALAARWCALGCCGGVHRSARIERKGVMTDQDLPAAAAGDAARQLGRLGVFVGSSGQGRPQRSGRPGPATRGLRLRHALAAGVGGDRSVRAGRLRSGANGAHHARDRDRQHLRARRRWRPRPRPRPWRWPRRDGSFSVSACRARGWSPTCAATSTRSRCRRCAPTSTRWRRRSIADPSRSTTRRPCWRRWGHACWRWRAIAPPGRFPIW